jgi:hypothetical protein
VFKYCAGGPGGHYGSPWGPGSPGGPGNEFEPRPRTPGPGPLPKGPGGSRSAGGSALSEGSLLDRGPRAGGVGPGAGYRTFPRGGFCSLSKSVTMATPLNSRHRGGVGGGRTGDRIPSKGHVLSSVPPPRPRVGANIAQNYEIGK